MAGKKGRSGRSSKYVELANAQTLASMYFEPQNQEEIESAIRKGKFSIQQRHILNAMEGDQKAIDVIAKKLFPDKVEVQEETTLKLDV